MKKGSRQDVREIDDGVLGSGGRGAVTGEDAVESGTVIDHPPPSAPVFVPPNTFTFRSPGGMKGGEEAGGGGVVEEDGEVVEEVVTW